MVNSSYSYGDYDGGLGKAKILYEVIIKESEKNIDNIDSYGILINMDYLDLMLKNGLHSNKKEVEGESYAKLAGTFVFDTSGKSKQEVENMNLLKSVEIIDKDKNEVFINFNNQ